MRVSGKLYYPISDHLGSTSLTLNASGQVIAELRYKPFGETRFTKGNTPTDRRYTSQRQQMDTGLYFYNARWYDPALGRFTSADTVIPGAGSPQAWDRYAYGLNNPLRFTDPTGHNQCDQISNDGAREECNTSRYGKEQKAADEIHNLVLNIYKDMADESDIAFNYPLDGCYARAHLMTQRILERYGITPYKVWAIAPDKKPLLTVDTGEPYGEISWDYHVAAAFSVKSSDGKVAFVVIDPSIASGPVSIQEWAEAMDAPGEVSLQITSLGVAPIEPGTWLQYPGSGYWTRDDPYPETHAAPVDRINTHIAKTMAKYLACGNAGIKCSLP